MHLRYSARTVLLTVVAVGIIAGSYAFLFRSPVVGLYGGWDGLRIIASPTKVEAYLLGELPTEIQLEEATPFDFPVARGPVQLSSAAANDASAALRSPDSFGWDHAKACGPPIYGARLSFHRERDGVDVYLCFACDYLCVCRNGKVVGGEDFDAARSALLNVIVDCFPDSSEPSAARLSDDGDASRKGAK